MCKVCPCRVWGVGGVNVPPTAKNAIAAKFGALWGIWENADIIGKKRKGDERAACRPRWRSLPSPVLPHGRGFPSPRRLTCSARSSARVAVCVACGLHGWRRLCRLDFGAGLSDLLRLCAVARFKALYGSFVIRLRCCQVVPLFAACGASSRAVRGFARAVRLRLCVNGSNFGRVARLPFVGAFTRPSCFPRVLWRFWLSVRVACLGGVPSVHPWRVVRVGLAIRGEGRRRDP